MNKKKTLTALLITAFIFSSFMTLTYGEKVISTYGTLETEGVDVNISAIQDERLIAPNMTVKYEPVIRYRGVDAYIRFRIDLSNDFLKQCEFQGLSHDWVKRGDYYYYTEIVKHGDMLSTFKSFHIPDNFDEEMPEGFMNSEFNITAYADAVQAENFTPDFTGDNPWGELVIEDNSYDGSSYRGVGKKDSDIIAINFKGAGQYSLNKDELVNSGILPGDTYRNSIKLVNTGERDMEVFFSVDKENTEDAYNLLDSLKLIISVDNEEIYRGSLRAAEFNSWKNIMYMEKGSEHEINYQIHAPKELGNSYEEKLNNFTWNFKVRGVHEGPKTGDTESLLFWIVSGIAALILLKKVKEGDADEE